jgi:putative ABC transport system ATP-binding protein
MLKTTGLKYLYKHGKTIEFPDIEIETGQRLLISGFSGCGKTTLLSLIAGALRLQEGSINFNDTDYSDMSSISPFLNVSENIALGIKFSKNRKSKVSDMHQEIERLISSLGLEKEILNTAIDNLSVGQQQRVAVARALLGKPDLILADEPTSALDNDTTKKFLDEVMNTFDPSHQAIIMVSHDLSIAPYFDTVLDFNKHNAHSII